MAITLKDIGPIYAFETTTDVIVTTAWSLLGTIVFRGGMSNGFEFQVNNTGSFDLVDFKITSTTTNGVERDLISGTTWSSTGVEMIKEATSPSPNLCAAGTQASATVQKPGMHVISFYAKGSGITTVGLTGQIGGR